VCAVVVVGAALTGTAVVGGTAVVVVLVSATIDVVVVSGAVLVVVEGASATVVVCVVLPPLPAKATPVARMNIASAPTPTPKNSRRWRRAAIFP
jgi:hypothetical protein